MKLTVLDILTSSNKYPNREKDKECTDQVRANASHLIIAVNSLLEDLGIDTVSVSSGFRTQAVNASLSNSAKKSLHCLGMAVDLVDHDGELAKSILKRPELLVVYNLWMEDTKSTQGWVHMDQGTRKPRVGPRVFIP